MIKNVIIYGVGGAIGICLIPFAILRAIPDIRHSWRDARGK